VSRIQDFRNLYAHYIVGNAGSSNERLISAFASVKLERYVGKGPWQVLLVGARRGYISTLSDDPRLVYQDILIGLDADRGINNGEPGLHALCLSACEPREGEAVLHIGAGTGYYSAILANLVGSTGSVIAYEIDPSLAERARVNLAQLKNVKVVAESATTAALPNADVIYVNAGATAPPALWLDALNVGGRLLFPMTQNQGPGFMLLITRRGNSTYGATSVTRAAFIGCIGARDEAESNALAKAMASRSIRSVRSLHRGTEPDETAWCVGAGWWLSTADTQWSPTEAILHSCIKP